MLCASPGCLRPSSPIEDDELFDGVEEVEESVSTEKSQSNHPIVVKRRQAKFGPPPDPMPIPTSTAEPVATQSVVPTTGPTSVPTSVPTPVSQWYQEAYIKASNADKDDRFGSSVSISGDTLAVGAYEEDSNQTTITNGKIGASSNNSAVDSGAVYVYRRTHSDWAQEAYIKAGNLRYLDKFGQTVSLSGDTLAVGAPEEDSDQNTITNGTGSSASDILTHSGAVYVYRRSGVQWAQEAFIKAVNVGYQDFFGSKVSLSGTSLVVAADYEDNSQNTVSNGTAVSEVGSSEESGAVYVYRRNGTQWSQEAYIKHSNLDGHDHFGTNVSIFGDTLAVGAYGEDSSQKFITNGTTASGDNAAPDAGAVYVYRRTGNQWAQEAYLKASNAQTYDNFGSSLALSGGVLAVGVPSEDSAQTTITNGSSASSDNSLTDAGAVYIFRRSGDQWAQEAYVKAVNAGRYDAFGRGLALSGTTLVVGAPQEDSNQTTITNGPTANSEDIAGDSGATYIYLYKNGQWGQEAYLKASNARGYVHTGKQGDLFGACVSLSGDSLVVSAPQESSAQTTITNGTTASEDNSKFHSGAVYVYRNKGRMFDPDVRVLGSTSSQVSFEWTNNLGMAQQVKVAVAVSGITAPPAHCEGGTVLPASASSYIYKELSSLTKYGFRFCAWDGAMASEGTTVWFDTRGWYQEAYVKAANAGSYDGFGRSMSLNGDTLAVGAREEDSQQTTITNGSGANIDNSKENSGAVYVYRRSGTHWAQEAYIKAVNADKNDYFGTRVSISGDTLVVGASGEGSTENTITNDTTASTNNAEPNAGAVYVYRRTGTEWAQEAYVKAANAQGYIPYNPPVTSGQSPDYFGSQVAVNADTFVVGVSQEDASQSTITNGTGASANNSASDSGAVYVYRRSGSVWAQEAFIKASNVGQYDNFGSSVSLHGDTLAVGAPNEDSNQTVITNGPTASSNNDATESGAVYVFRRNGTQWAQEAFVKAANADVYDHFGVSVAVSGDVLVVGAPEEDSDQKTITNGSTASVENILGDSGAAYIYRRLGIEWAQEAYVKAANVGGYINTNNSGDRFGYAVAVSGETVVVGAYHEDSSQSTITNSSSASSDDSLKKSGAVYIYRRLGNMWSQEAYVKGVNAGNDDYFGSSVSISGDTLAVGAYGEDSNQSTVTNGPAASQSNNSSDSGAVYIYRNLGRMFDPDVQTSEATTTSLTFRWVNNFGSGHRIKLALAVSGTDAPPAYCEGGFVLNSGVESYTYSGLSPNTKYGFRFCAWDGGTASSGTLIWATTEP